MSYRKHNFKSGEKWYAEQANDMDNQIAKNEEEIVKLANVHATDLKTINGKFAADAEKLRLTAAKLENMIQAAYGITYTQIMDWERSAERTVAYDSRRLLSYTDGVMPWAKIVDLCGMSYGWNQFVAVENESNVTDERSYINNGDGSITVSSGVVSSATQYKLNKKNVNLIGGHTYYYRGMSTNQALSFRVIRMPSGASITNTPGLTRKTFTVESDTEASLRLYILSGRPAFSNDTVRPLMFDLTAIFGAGNEPSMDEFDALFPEVYYPYAEVGSFAHAAIDRIIVKRPSGTETVYNVPDVIKNIPGYGYGIDDVTYNAVSIGNGTATFSKCVDIVDGVLAEVDETTATITGVPEDFGYIEVRANDTVILESNGKRIPTDSSIMYQISLAEGDVE